MYRFVVGGRRVVRRRGCRDGRCRLHVPRRLFRCRGVCLPGGLVILGFCAAGSKTVYELHGSTLRNYCTRCGKFYDVDFIANSTGVPRCTECGGIVKPDVVLYEEGLDEEVLSGAVDAIRHADTLIIGGTSLVVYPAAGLIRYFRGDNLVVINMQPTGADASADLCIAKPIGQVLSEDISLD